MLENCEIDQQTKSKCERHYPRSFFLPSSWQFMLCLHFYLRLSDLNEAQGQPPCNEWQKSVNPCRLDFVVKFSHYFSRLSINYNRLHLRCVLLSNRSYCFLSLFNILSHFFFSKYSEISSMRMNIKNRTVRTMPMRNQRLDKYSKAPGVRYG